MNLATRIIAAAMLVAGSSTAVYALSKHSEWQMTPQEKAEFATDRVSDKLGLDNTQRQNFSELANLVAAIVTETRAGDSEHFEEMSALLRAPSFDQSRALQLIEEKTNMVNARAPRVVASLAVFLDSLNSEQKQRLEDFIEHRRQHHGNHRWH